MRFLRYNFRLIIAFLNKFKGLILLSACLGVVIYFLTSFIIPKILAIKKQTIGISGRFTIDSLPQDISDSIGGGLTKVDSSGLPQPNIAQSWETPDSGKTWIFHLKDNTYWQDGKKLISSDIVYKFSDVNISYPNDKTIVFTLKAPYIPFPVIVSKPIFKKGILGTGEWRAIKISLVGDNLQKLVLKKGSEQKIYKFYPTEDQLKFAYKMGEVEKITDLTSPTPFDDWGNSRVTEIVNNSQSVVVFFNTEDPLLSEKNLRQALSYAINKDALSSSRSISPLSPSSFAYNPQVKTYNYDPAKSKQIINDLQEQNKSELSIKLVSSPSLLTTAEIIADNWKAVGVNVQVLVTSIVPSDYQAYLTIFDIPPDPDQYFLWHSTQTDTNITKYKNPRIDKLLEDGRLEMKLEERKKIYFDFQRFLLEDSPAAFLYHPVWYDVARK